MTPKEFKAAQAITEFFNNSIQTGPTLRWRQRQDRNDRLTELLFEFAAATVEAHDANKTNKKPATDVI